MMNQIGRPDQLEIRITAWILYLLRGGKPEVLERILESEANPRSKRYRLLFSIIVNNRSGLEGGIRPEDKDLLISENSGYALDLDLNDPHDQVRLRKINALARLALYRLRCSETAVIRRQGLFCDKATHPVDIDLTIERKHVQQLAGDLFLRHKQEILMLQGYNEATSWLAHGPTAYLFTRRTWPLLRTLCERLSPVEPLENSSNMESWLVINSLSPQEDLTPYATHLLARDVTLLRFGARELFAFTEPANFVRRVVGPDFVDVDLSQAQRVRQEEWQIPDSFKSYRLLAVISIGPTSVTYRAEDVDSAEHSKVVALKIFNPQFSGGHFSRPPLDSHAAILSPHRFLRDGRFVFFVMEYMSGGNLEGLLQILPVSLRFRFTLRALDAVCEALAFAHKQEVFHGTIEAEKVLFATQSQRFRINYAILSDVNIRPTSEEQRSEAVQKDLHDVGAVFANLLANMQVPWLQEILRRCQDRGFQDAAELHSALINHLKPEKSLLIVLTADFDDRKKDNRIVHYHLDIDGSRNPELLTVKINKRFLECLYQKWELLGKLALERAEVIDQGRPTDALDENIRALLSEISDAETHSILGPKVQGELEKNTKAVLWVRYHSSLSPTPWELLELGGLRVCRQFCIARSPLLFTGADHHGLARESRIRLLIIEDPDGDLNGARAECHRLREQFKWSPLSDRIDVDTVGAATDPLAMHRKILEADIVHFAGHGHFDEKYTEDSGLSLGAGEILTGGEVLNGFWLKKRPFLIFANACDSGRNNQQALRQRVYSDAATGLGQAFLASGVSNYIGALWKAPDGNATIDFAVEFYRWFLSGCTVSQAIQAARDSCFSKYGEEDLTWARYVLFGHPLNRIEI
jgi:serine/threonine protein kinase